VKTVAAKAVLSRLAGGVRDLFFPPGCLACDAAVDEPATALCARCAAGLASWITLDYCRCCGLDAGPHLLTEQRCTACSAARPPYARLARVGRYAGTLRDLVLRFKYGRTPILDGLLGDLMHDAVAGDPAFASVRAWIPVPSPWRRIWRRGFQPTRLLADRLAARTGRPRLDALRLVRAIAEQKDLPPHERGPNVRAALAAREPRRLTGMAVGLVDDVFTTGATLREAARTLRAAGAASVTGVVVAVAAPGEDALPTS
jgi:ComF family protein